MCSKPRAELAKPLAAFLTEVVQDTVLGHLVDVAVDGLGQVAGGRGDGWSEGESGRVDAVPEFSDQMVLVDRSSGGSRHRR